MLSGASVNEWYRVAVNGEGRPANTPVPSCTISDVLPCINSGAPTTSAPYTCPMAWWPRHTPNTGVPMDANAPIDSQMMPLVSGRPGPGDSSTASGANATASSTDN